jgi:putative transposase
MSGYEVAIRAAHVRSRETYGSRCLQPELREEGFVAGRDRITRLRREMGLRCKQKRRFRATTNSEHNLPVAENLLEQRFVFTCEIIGYAMGARMIQELTARALFRAVQQKRPPPRLIHHSNRGSHYCAQGYRALLEQFGLKASMSRRGNCYDNAPMESFWGSLKNELVHHRRDSTRAEAEASIREYIEIFYNRQRHHSRLGYLAPAVFAQNFRQHAGAA